MKSRLLLLPVAITAGALLVACGDPNATKAMFANADAEGSVFALNGAPESGPTAVDISYDPPRGMRASPNTQAHWDVVFDIDSAGQALALPPALVSWSPLFFAGLQPTTTPYDQITSAPTSGYLDSSAVLIQPGSVFFIQSYSYACTSQAVISRRYLYAKMIIDSIHYFAYDPLTAPSGRTIYYRVRSDPNCGFTGLDSGIPSN